MDMDVQSDLRSLKKLYSVLQIRGNAQHGSAHALESLDEKSRKVLKKLLDGATEQAWIQFHAKMMAESATTSSLLPEAPENSSPPEAPRRPPSVLNETTADHDHDHDPVGSRTRNKMAAQTSHYYHQSTNKESSQTLATAPSPPPNNLQHFETPQTQSTSPCPICICNTAAAATGSSPPPPNAAAATPNINPMPKPKEEEEHHQCHSNHSCIRCKHHHHHHRLRRGLSTMSRRSAEESDVPVLLRQMESLRLTGRNMTPRRTQPHRDRPPAKTQPIRPPTHQFPDQSRRRKHMDSSLSLPKHESTIMKSHVGPTASQKDSVHLRASATQSRDGREQKKKSAQTKLVGPTSSTKLQLPRDVAGRRKYRDEEGDSRTAASMNHKQQQHPSMKRAGGTEKRKVGPACENQRSISCSYKKLPPSEFPSRTSSSYMMTESTEESASQSSSTTPLSQRTSKQPWMRKKNLGKYYSSSSSSSSSSPHWLVSRPVWSLRRRPRAVREEPAEKRGGRLRRFKNKLAVIFHHHHHHYHRGGDSEVESPTTPSKNDPHLPSATAAAVIREGPRRRHHGHGLHTLLQRLLRHVWHSGMEEGKADDRRVEMGKKGGRLVGAGRNGRWLQGAAAAGVKPGSRKKKPRLGLGFPKTQRNKTQAL